jgi:DNA polymerase III delta prime subunit
LKGVNTALRAEAWGGGWLVIIIDGADQLSEAEFMALRPRMERPPSRAAFVLCTSDLAGIPGDVASFFHPLEIAPPPIRSRIRLARRICQGEEVRPDNAALERLALVTGGNLRRLACAIETLSSRGGLSLEAVRDAISIGPYRPSMNYVRSVAQGKPLDEQLDLLSGEWTATPAEKARRVEEMLGALFRREVAHQVSGYSVIDDFDAEESSRIVEHVQGKASQRGATVRAFWHSILKLWGQGPCATETSLIVRASEFDELVNGGEEIEGRKARRSRLLRMRLRAAEIEHSSPTAEPQGVRRRPSAQLARDQHLTKAQARALWDAASFLRQQYGLLLNTRITLRYDQLGVQSSGTGGLLSDLTRELKMKVERESGLGRFHWLYVHEDVPPHGRASHLACHMPLESMKLETWLLSFLARHCPGEASRTGLTLRRRATADPNQDTGVDADAAWHVHFGLVRLLCRGLDPSVPQGRRKKLIDLLGVDRRLQTPIGSRFGAQRYGVSESIGPGAREEASRRYLPVRSSFEHWADLTTRWEGEEHEYRRSVEKEHELKRAQVVRDWGNDRAKLAEFEMKWAREADKRVHARPDWPSSASHASPTFAK